MPRVQHAIRLLHRNVDGEVRRFEGHDGDPGSGHDVLEHDARLAPKVRCQLVDRRADEVAPHLLSLEAIRPEAMEQQHDIEIAATTAIAVRQAQVRNIRPKRFQVEPPAREQPSREALTEKGQQRLLRGTVLLIFGVQGLVDNLQRCGLGFVAVPSKPLVLCNGCVARPLGRSIVRWPIHEIVIALALALSGLFPTVLVGIGDRTSSLVVTKSIFGLRGLEPGLVPRGEVLFVVSARVSEGADCGVLAPCMDQVLLVACLTSHRRSAKSYAPGRADAQRTRRR
mmetsp:Transcript_9704/g.28124  ORF Transcript_9704/g.28124 Transcript_9704/m.28124 type:complete len:283 (-) Transcript_9704:19-867(-)